MMYCDLIPIESSALRLTSKTDTRKSPIFFYYQNLVIADITQHMTQIYSYMGHFSYPFYVLGVEFHISEIFVAFHH